MWMMEPKYLFEAIRMVETGGEFDPANAVGDNGLSLGPYQISEAYWIDAVEHCPEIGGSYNNVRDARYAERIMMAYWDRYAPDETWETLARIHNGGPQGLRASTDRYWRKVSKELETIQLVGDFEKTWSISRESEDHSRSHAHQVTERSS